MDSACGDAPQRSPRKFSAPSAFQALSSPHRRRPREKRQHGKSLGSLLGVLVLSLCASRPVRSQTSILGFTPSSATRENQIETKFKAIPSPDEERRQHHLFTAEPHVAGSPRNNELARYIADQWRQEGLDDVVIRRYDVYGSNPKFTSLEMVAPIHYRAIAARDCPSPATRT